jgi:hypothetical protein
MAASKFLIGATLLIGLIVSKSSGASSPQQVPAPVGVQFTPQVPIDTVTGHYKTQSADRVVGSLGNPNFEALTTTPSAAQKPTYYFNIIAGISKVTADYYGGFAAAKALIQAQIATVNSRFNNPGVFNAIYNFTVDSIYQFTGDPVAEIGVPHPGFSYRVTYDGYPTQGGGWYGPPWNSIHHSWSVSSFGGTFANFATDGIVHEFGHSRGAIDLYAIQVDATKNPVNGLPYSAANSIMNYPYGNLTWDTHSIYLINRTADTVIANSNYIDESFPANMGIAVRDSTGVGQLAGATVKLYPVSWYSSTVGSTASLIGTTGPTGVLPFSTNPFGPYANAPWNLQYPNFVVAVTFRDSLRYSWLPLPNVQNAFFTKPDTTYRLIVRMPLSCCQGKTGNVNMIGSVDLADLSSLVSYLTGGGYQIGCPSAANVNSTGSVDLADLSGLVNYLTGGGYVLPSCP